MKKSLRSRIVMALFCLPALSAGVAHADDQQFGATLSGAQEVVFDDGGELVPGGVDTGATGRINARFDRGFTQLRVHLRINGLTGTFAAAHFHCARPGENGPVVFGLVNPGPLAFDGRRILGTLTNADFTGADCAETIGRPVNNLIALALAMRDGLIYSNVHTDVFPGGEIRGQMLERDGDEDDDD